jgi:hypothetical protein
VDGPEGGQGEDGEEDEEGISHWRILCWIWRDLF